MDDKIPSHQMHHLGMNQQSHWLQGLLYFENEWVLCMTSTVATTIEENTCPLGSTELNDNTGHNCKMLKALYKAFFYHILGLPPKSWASCQTEVVSFRNLIIQDIDAMMYYYDIGCYDANQLPLSYPGNQTDMVRILACLILLLVGTDACTTHINNSMWGQDDDAWIALGGPQ
jgi:hypothetical protein